MQKEQFSEWGWGERRYTDHTFIHIYFRMRWWRDTVVERRSLAGELSLSCARPAADG